MLIPGETFSESYEAVPASVALARNALTGFARDAGADQEQLEAVRLAASEAVTNAVMHAYNSCTRGSVQVSATYVENELWLLVADSGDGMRPNANSPGLGLGLALIAQLVDEFQILSRGSGGTELRLRFKLARAERPDHQRARNAGARARGQAPRGSPSAPASGRHDDARDDRGSVSIAFSAA